jgi:hypothetical protein
VKKKRCFIEAMIFHAFESNNTRYRKHIQAVSNNNSNSGYSNHILNTGHKYGTITDIMDIMGTHRKGKHLNKLEEYHMCKTSKNNLQMGDTNLDTTKYSKDYRERIPGSSTYAVHHAGKQIQNTRETRRTNQSRYNTRENESNIFNKRK